MKSKIIFSICLVAIFLAIIFPKKNRETEESAKKFLLENRNTLRHIDKIKQQFFLKNDNTLFYLIEYTGKAFFTVKQQKDSDRWIVENFLPTSDSGSIHRFMYKENLNKIFIYQDKIKYCFDGSDYIVINDDSFKNEDGDIELEKNVYFHPLSKKDE